MVGAAGAGDAVGRGAGVAMVGGGMAMEIGSRMGPWA